MKRILLVLQGEGRGHQTQALAFTELARQKGYEIVGAVVSTPDGNTLPSLLAEQATFPIFPIASPGLGYTQSHRLSLSKTFLQTLLGAPKLVRSLDQLHRIFLSQKPTWVINFYEPLWGIYAGLFRPKVFTTAIAHQYLILDPKFPFPPRRTFEKWVVQAFTRLTAYRADELWGLSFTPLTTTVPRLKIVPPLLRQIIRLSHPTTGRYWLAYFTQPAYVQELIAWSRKNPSQPIHLFGALPPAAPLPKQLQWHPISGKHFLEKLVGCEALITTAGFESIAEAHFLGKPVYAIPLPGHYEQACNASDWARTGGGLSGDRLLLDGFQTWLKNRVPSTQAPWVMADLTFWNSPKEKTIRR